MCAIPEHLRDISCGGTIQIDYLYLYQLLLHHYQKWQSSTSSHCVMFSNQQYMLYTPTSHYYWSIMHIWQAIMTARFVLLKSRLNKNTVLTKMLCNWTGLKEMLKVVKLNFFGKWSICWNWLLTDRRFLVRRHWPLDSNKDRPNSTLHGVQAGCDTCHGAPQGLCQCHHWWITWWRGLSIAAVTAVS